MCSLLTFDAVYLSDCLPDGMGIVNHIFLKASATTNKMVQEKGNIFGRIYSCPFIRFNASVDLTKTTETEDNCHLKIRTIQNVVS